MAFRAYHFQLSRIGEHPGDDHVDDAIPIDAAPMMHLHIKFFTPGSAPLTAAYLAGIEFPFQCGLALSTAEPELSQNGAHLRSGCDGFSAGMLFHYFFIPTILFLQVVDIAG